MNLEFKGEQILKYSHLSRLQLASLMQSRLNQTTTVAKIETQSALAADLLDAGLAIGVPDCALSARHGLVIAAIAAFGSDKCRGKGQQ